MSANSKAGIQRAAHRSFQTISSEKLRLSFKFFDLSDELFFLEGMQNSWYGSLFAALQMVKDLTAEEFARGDSVTAKPIGWSTGRVKRTCFPQPSEQRPEVVEQQLLMRERCFEFRITKNRGRVHGFLHSNTFYVVWIDPAHNLIPGKERLRSMDEYREVKGCSIEVINQLTDEREKLNAEVARLQLENAELMQILDSSTS